MIKNGSDKNMFNPDHYDLGYNFVHQVEQKNRSKILKGFRMIHIRYKGKEVQIEIV